MSRGKLRVAYVCHWDPFAEDGVGRKIRSQTAMWRTLGADARLFYVSRAFHHDEPVAPSHASWFLYRNPVLGRAAATLRLGRAVRRWEPDVVYLRYTVLVPPLRRLLRAFPTVVEVNTDDQTEYRLRSPLRRAANAISRQLVLGAAQGFVGVTPDLTRGIAPSNRHARRVCITNGVRLLDAPPSAPRPHERPRLAFLASAPDPWQGVDKVVWLASALPEFDFDLVCPDSGTEDQTPGNLDVHGYSTPAECDAILAGADVAIGTLALHRKQMSQATPLKVRDYLRNGLPVIVGYDDPDLEDYPWFVLRLPNTEGNVRDAVHQIRDYVMSVAGRRVGPAEVRHRIDIAGKERRRLAFLQEVAAAPRGRTARFGHGPEQAPATRSGRVG